MSKIKDRILRTEKVAWKKLKPFQPGNLKTMTAESFERLKNNILKNDFLTSFYVWVDENKDYWLLDGHHRLHALEQLEKDGADLESEYTCSVVDANTAKEAVEILLSYSSSHAKLDPLGVSEFIHTNDLDWTDLQNTLDLASIDLEKLKNENIDILEPQQDDEDEVPELKVEATTKIGDLWILGNHRLMCGDSTNIQSVEKLIGEKAIDMVFTDPPYGINENTNRVSSKRSQAAKAGVYDKILGDDSTQTAIDAFNLCATYNFPVMVFWGANHYCHALPESANWLVWDKREEDKERDGNSDCELAWVKSKYKSVRIFRHKWKGMIKASERGESRCHPTQKPIALAEWAFSEYASDSKNILDLFGGSGSTLIACEKTNKSCAMMELSPSYCDVIIKRWQDYTGKKAVHEESKKNFDDLSPLV